MFDYYLNKFYFILMPQTHRQDTRTNEITNCTSKSVVYQVIHFEGTGLTDQLESLY